VGSIHFSISEEDLRTIFEPFGEVVSLQLHKDPETGRSRGFGFVQYRNHEDAKKALEQLNGLDLAGRPLKVRIGLSYWIPIYFSSYRLVWQLQRLRNFK